MKWEMESISCGQSCKAGDRHEREREACLIRTTTLSGNRLDMNA